MKVAGMTSKRVINRMSQVAESVGDIQTGDDMKKIGCVNTDNTTIVEKSNQRIQTAIHISIVKPKKVHMFITYTTTISYNDKKIH